MRDTQHSQHVLVRREEVGGVGRQEVNPRKVRRHLLPLHRPRGVVEHVSAETPPRCSSWSPPPPRSRPLLDTQPPPPQHRGRTLPQPQLSLIRASVPPPALMRRTPSKTTTTTTTTTTTRPTNRTTQPMDQQKTTSANTCTRTRMGVHARTRHAVSCTSSTTHECEWRAQGKSRCTMSRAVAAMSPSAS